MPNESAFDEFDEFSQDRRGPKRSDATALRILAEWVAQHVGEDPRTHAMFDREFVVGEVSIA